jgi:hypothetical protein
MNKKKMRYRPHSTRTVTIEEALGMYATPELRKVARAKGFNIPPEEHFGTGSATPNPVPDYRDKIIKELEALHKSEVERLKRDICSLRRRPPCTAKEIEGLVILRNAGWNVRQIAKFTSRSPSTVKRDLVEADQDNVANQIRELTK